MAAVRRTILWLAPAALLALSGCGVGRDEQAAVGNAAAAAANEAAATANESKAAAGPAMACPFRRTRDWVGSVEYGHVRINGYVDIQMAGFRPALTERSGAAAGTLALDLALAPEPNAPISDHARYERRGAPPYRRTEIWCGGERLAAFDMIVVQ